MKALLGRIGLLLLTAWAAITINFFIPRLMKGNAVDAILGQVNGAQVDPRAVQSLRIAFGLDKSQNPVAEYFQYLGNIFHGDLGISLHNFPQPVSDVIGQALPWTLLLVGVSTLISFLIGTGLGIISGWRRGSWLDVLAPVTTFFSSMPYFWFALIMLTVFAINLNVLPFQGGYSGDTVIGWNGPFILSALQHAILPAFTIIIASLGGWLIGMRNMMVTTQAEDYMLVAEAKGLSVWRRSMSYGARNAVLPNITGFALSLGFVVSGAILTEIVFSYPGIGFLLYQAVQNRDFPLMQGLFLIITLTVLGANLIADVSYTLLDPRTRKNG